jgi:alpha/beta superfamily hydrolase
MWTRPSLQLLGIHFFGFTLPLQMVHHIISINIQVSLSLFTDFEDFSMFKPAQFQENYVNSMLDQVIAWGNALKTFRI